MFFPLTNPIRFTKNSTLASSSVFPSIDNQLQRVEYYGDNKKLSYYKEFFAGKTLIFQYNNSASVTVTPYKDGAAQTTISATEITPSGWVSGKVFKHSITLTKGVWYFITDNGYTSDTIFVTDKIKNIVEISYFNSYNDFDTVFYSGTTKVFNPVNYFSGSFVEGIPFVEYGAYKSDENIEQKMRATSVREYAVNLFAVHKTLIASVIDMFNCDNITINGVECSNAVPTIENIEGVDCVNISAKLSQKTNNHRTR